jgi:hypothetical protein
VRERPTGNSNWSGFNRDALLQGIKSIAHRVRSYTMEDLSESEVLVVLHVRRTRLIRLGAGRCVRRATG